MVPAVGTAVVPVVGGALVPGVVGEVVASDGVEVNRGVLLDVDAALLAGVGADDVVDAVDRRVGGAAGAVLAGGFTLTPVVGTAGAGGRTFRYSAPRATNRRDRTSVDVRARPRWEGTDDHQRGACAGAVLTVGACGSGSPPVESGRPP